MKSWSPDIAKINKLINTSDPQFSNNQRDNNAQRYRILHPFLTEDGGLIFHSESSSLVKIDKDSQLVWQNQENAFHHSIEKDFEGNFWIPSQIFPYQVEYFGSNYGDYKDDAITKISENGEILFQKSVANLLIECLEHGGTIFWCGNGGSASDSQHLAGELVGRFVGEREPLKSIALTADSAVMTCIVNDYGYKHIFSRQIEALGSKGDILIGISTSGNSENVIHAFEVAKQIEIYNTLFKELNMYYIDEINPAELTNKAIKNTLKGLDPYTVFYDEQEVEDARIRKEGEYGGIGVSTYYSKKGIQINEIYKGYSADRAGLKAGDLIISIDGQSVQNMERDQLSLFLKGIPNSRFTLQLMRQGEVIKKEISRDKIIMKAVPFAEMIDSVTGDIALTAVKSRASAEVKKAYQQSINQCSQR